MTDHYKTISNVKSEGFYSEKRSKFFAFAHHAETPEEAISIVNSYKQEHFKARHHCFAYRLTPGMDVFRVNDDGEPSGTAGKPIFGQIKSFELTDVLIVVIRYFGGVKLGASGLINAYKEAAKDALSHAEIVTEYVMEQRTFSFPYPKLNDVMRIVDDMGIAIVDKQFASDCTFTFSIRKSLVDIFDRKTDEINF